jgi:hypothetical protein
MTRFRDPSTINQNDYDRGLVQKAIKRWLGVDESSTIFRHQFYDFAAFIGDPCPPDDPANDLNWRVRIVDTEKQWVRDIIDKINGPYGDVILAAMKARHDGTDRD